MIAPETLRDDLVRLGLNEGDSVLVHVAFSKVGYVAGGPQSLIAALRATAETVLFPAHTGHADVRPGHPPAFDVRQTPTRGIGIVPEAARQHPAAVRSLDPTHSVVGFGARAVELLSDHRNSESPCDDRSPYARLADTHGHILLIGCDHSRNTTIHHVEERADLPYHLFAEATPVEMIDQNGELVRRTSRFHRWDTPRDFMRFDDDLTAANIQRLGQVGGATSRLVKAAELRDFLLDRVRRHPMALVKR